MGYLMWLQKLTGPGVQVSGSVTHRLWLLHRHVEIFLDREVKPMSPEFAGRFLSTEPAKSKDMNFFA